MEAVEWRDSFTTCFCPHHLLSRMETSRAVHLPPEILSHICASVRDPGRNRTLAALCLVSKVWRNAANQEMYGNIIVRWHGGSAARLLRTFRSNQALFLVVRTLDVAYPGHRLWMQDCQKSEAGARITDVSSKQWPTEDEASDETRIRYIQHACVGIRIWSGDDEWLRDGPAHQTGSDVFFNLIQYFSVGVENRGRAKCELTLVYLPKRRTSSLSLLPVSTKTWTSRDFPASLEQSREFGMSSSTRS